MSNKDELRKIKTEFLEELFNLYDKHGVSISHEDGHGAFMIEIGTDPSSNKSWITSAFIETNELYGSDSFR